MPKQTDDLIRERDESQETEKAGLKIPVPTKEKFRGRQLAHVRLLSSDTFCWQNCPCPAADTHSCDRNRDAAAYEVSNPMPSVSAPMDRSRPPVGTR
jgi:hypothetical protein